MVSCVGLFFLSFLFDAEIIVEAVGDFPAPFSAAVRYGGTARHSVSPQRLPEVLRRERQTCSTEDLRQRLARVQCDADYLNALRNAECSYPAAFYRLARVRFTLRRGYYPECSRDDSTGMLCGEHNSAKVAPRSIAKVIIKNCLATPGNCSGRCRTTLKAFASRFGCCIHSLAVIESENLIRALTPQLWDDCGVTRPEPCGNGPLAPASLNPNVSCSYTCTVQQSLALFCKYQAADVIQAYRECNREQGVLRTIQTCGFNNGGDLCGLVSRTGFILLVVGSVSIQLDEEYVRQMYDTCIDFALTGKCSSECREALVRARDRFGCCLSSINSKALRFTSFDGDLADFVTSSELWSTCVVQPPSLCQLPTDLSLYDKLTQCELCQLQPTSSDDDFPLVAVIGGAAALIMVLVVLVPVVFCCCCYKRYI